MDPDELGAALGEIGAVDAVGHRIVHGGHRFRGAVRVDDGVVAALRDLTELAPLHQPKSLAALDAVGRALPDVPAVACFDTAFHAGLPEPAATYALPRELRERFGLRRFGFHGLSHAYVARHVAELAERPISELRTISCHLGAGASLTAIAGGRSVETTMGFTPLEGLVMATRSGSVDPGLMLWLLERGDMDEPELADALEHESGLAGLAGTPRMQDVLAAADRGDEDATPRARRLPAPATRRNRRDGGRARRSGRDRLHRRRRRAGRSRCALAPLRASVSSASRSTASATTPPRETRRSAPRRRRPGPS